MSTKLHVTGGARIGWTNATWPFARLSAAAGQLSISGMLLGHYAFSPDQVVALKPYGVIPLIGRGIRIVHTVAHYPEQIIFWCFGSPERLIDRIADTGFRPRATTVSRPQRDGMAFRWQFVALVVALWNLLIFLGADSKFFLWNNTSSQANASPQASAQASLFPLLALILLFLTALGLIFSPRLQSWALKPGRSISEVRALVNLVLLVSVILLIGFGIQYAAL